MELLEAFGIISQAIANSNIDDIDSLNDHLMSLRNALMPAPVVSKKKVLVKRSKSSDTAVTDETVATHSEPATDWVQLDVDNFIKAYDSSRFDHIRWVELKPLVIERIEAHYKLTIFDLERATLPVDDEPEPATTAPLSPIDHDKMIQHFHALQTLLQDRAPHLVELLEEIKIEASSL